MSDNQNTNTGGDNKDSSLLGKILSTPSKETPEENINQPVNTPTSGNQNKEAPKLKKEPMKTKDFLEFFGALLVVSIIFFGAFLTYIVFNPEQAEFFINLGINPQDIKTLLKNLVNLSFGFITIVISIIWIVFLFKAILTKKEYKKKKTVFIILSIFTGIILFSGITLWAFLINQIGATNYANPYGGIIFYDNSKLLSEKFKDNAIMQTAEFNNLIGPVTVRFDFTPDSDYVGKYINITGYEIDFDGDGESDKEGNINPGNDDNIIYTYNKKGNFSPKGKYKGIDKITGSETEKPMKFPSLNITGLVKVTQTPQRMGGVMVAFDATDISKLGKILWYLEDDNFEKSAFEGYKYAPNKPFNEESAFCMVIDNGLKKGNDCDKLFIITKANDNSLKVSIQYQQDPLDPLLYIFSISEIKDKNVGIADYKWIIDEHSIISNESTAEFAFTSYGKHSIKVILTDLIGNQTEIKEDFTIRKTIILAKLMTNNPLLNNNSLLRIQDETGNSVIDSTYNKELSIYYIKIGLPQELDFNANFVKVTDPTYDLINVEWDFDGDGKYEKTGKNIKFQYLEEKKYNLTVKYTFTSKLKNDTQNIEEKIIIEGQKKNIDIQLKIVQESEYVPSIVHFDGSVSQVREGKITKFSYDFGEGKPPVDGDAKQDYKYNFPGEYIVTFTITKNDGEKQSIKRTIIVKEPGKQIIINSSMSSGITGKGIDFDAIGSVGQIDSYYWDFGDNSNSIEPNPTHIYEKAGVYKVSLVITFADGTIKNGSKDITIKKDSE